MSDEKIESACKELGIESSDQQPDELADVDEQFAALEAGRKATATDGAERFRRVRR